MRLCSYDIKNDFRLLWSILADFERDFRFFEKMMKSLFINRNVSDMDVNDHDKDNKERGKNLWLRYFS